MNRKLRVLYIASDEPGNGGSGKSLLEFISILKDNNLVEPIVINTNKNALNEKLDKMGIENYSIGYKVNVCRRENNKFKFITKYIIKYLRYLWGDIIARKNLDKVLDFSSIDLIHVNNSTQDISAYIRKKYDIPVVWHIREFGDKDFDLLYFKKNIGEFISLNADGVIAISDAIKQDWIAKGIDSKKITTIMHGVNPQGIEEAHHTNEKIRMVFTGKISRAKGQELFIHALSKLEPQYRKMIEVDFLGGGDDQYIQKLVMLANEKGLGSVVHFRGYCNNVKELLPSYDVGVVNSKSEGMGRVTIEYMFAGLCVIASNRGANIEIMKRSNSGFLYEYDNADSIIQCIKSICEDRDAIIANGKKAREYACGHFSIQKNVLDYYLFYQKILEADKK
ncbi:glycosyltransferase [Candidatus Bariatricus faecipullorum]